MNVETPAAPETTTTTNRASTVADEKMDLYRREMLSTSVERGKDLKSSRLFRQGELVWALLPRPIKAPQGTTDVSDIDTISVWPAIVVAPHTHTEVSREEGETPLAHYTKYDLRFCGNLDPDMTNPDAAPVLMLEETQVFPWHAIQVKTPKLDDIVENFYQQWVNTNEGVEMAKKSKKWKQKYAKRMKISQISKPENWETAVVHYAHALEFAMGVATSWTQTDGYTTEDSLKLMGPGLETRDAAAAADGSIFSGPDTTLDGHAPLAQDGLSADENEPRRSGSSSNSLIHQVKRRTYFQGLWWGPERIWMDDLVRMKIKRSGLPVGALESPSPGAEQRGVLLRIRWVSFLLFFHTMCVCSPPRKTCIIEQRHQRRGNPDGTDEHVPLYRSRRHVRIGRCRMG